MPESLSDQDQRLAPAHEAVLGGHSSSQADWAETKSTYSNAGVDNADDVYADLDLTAFPPTNTAFPESESDTYKPQHTHTGTLPLHGYISMPTLYLTILTAFSCTQGKPRKPL